jgi:DNA-binding CsgD family transcriptional regulator
MATSAPSSADPSAPADHWLRPGTLRLLRALFDDSLDGALAMHANGSRVYSNPALDAMVATDARQPIGTAAPPPYVPADQHREYWRILGETSYVLAEGQLASASLEVVSRDHRRTRAQLTLFPFSRVDGPQLAVWLFRAVRPASEALHPAAPAHTARSPELAVLTRREHEVLELLLGGQRVASIARRLFVSQHTVRNHLKSIFRKLHAHSQAELIDRYNAL